MQQWDSFRPALLILTIDITSKVETDLNVWCLDDRCIGGDPQTMLSNAATVWKWIIHNWPGESILNVSYLLPTTKGQL